MERSIRKSSDEDENIYRNYKIVSLNDKYGIENLSGNQIIDFVFDNIYWHKDENLVEFRLGDKYAICRVSEIPNLLYR